MSIKARHLIIASAALAIAAFQSPAIADTADPTIDFGSLKAEFAAEDAGATYGAKRRAFRAGTEIAPQAFRTTAEAAGPSYSAAGNAADFNTTRDWR